MKEIPMRFKGFAFSLNPKTVQLKMTKNISTTKIPFAGAVTQETGEMPCTVSGSGHFFGENAQEQALRLAAVFRRKGSAYLFTPVLPPGRMFFQSLHLGSSAGGEGIEYSVTFVQDVRGKQALYDFGYTFAKSGENLFDIANRTGVAAETLFGANDYETMFAVEEGDRVWLR